MELYIIFILISFMITSVLIYSIYKNSYDRRTIELYKLIAKKNNLSKLDRNIWKVESKTIER